ncbi:SDR family oxidoreductase [Pseudooceanicola sp. HF7]|nr:SDR family oxidoreductase [Pseudooceanicola sp. HF7]
MALITGAGSGIGKATALTLEASGYRVFICDVDPAAITALQAEAPGITGVVCNVADEAAVDATVDGVLKETGGRLDVLINNAGISGMNAPVEEVDSEDFRRTMDVNVNGTFYFLRRAVPALKALGTGTIVNIASTAALFGYPNRTSYAASKWAIIGLTKTLAMELGPFGIRVNAICPGSVEGPRIDGVIERDARNRGMDAAEVRRIYESQVSMRKFVSAEDIAGMCLFLASGNAGMVSGQVIAVDGHTESLSVPF